MRDSGLELLSPRQRRLRRISNDVDERDSIEANHLLEIDITGVISTNVLDRDNVVGAVRVGLEKIAKFSVLYVRCCEMEED